MKKFCKYDEIITKMEIILTKQSSITSMTMKTLFNTKLVENQVEKPSPINWIGLLKVPCLVIERL